MNRTCDHDYKPAFWASDPARGGVCFYCGNLAKHEPIELRTWTNLDRFQKEAYHRNGCLPSPTSSRIPETFDRKTQAIIGDLIQVIDKHADCEIEIPIALLALLEEIIAPDPYAHSAFIPVKFVLDKYRKAQMEEKEND